MKSKLLSCFFILLFILFMFNIKSFAFTYNGKILPDYPEIENVTQYPYTYAYYDQDYSTYYLIYSQSQAYCYRVNIYDNYTRYQIRFEDCLIYYWDLEESSSTWVQQDYSSRSIYIYNPIDAVNGANEYLLLYSSSDIFYDLSSSSDSQELDGTLYSQPISVDTFYEHAVYYWGDSLEDDPNWTGETPGEGGESGDSSDDDSILSSLTSWLQSIIDGILQIVSYINPFSDNFFGIKLIEMLSDTLTILFVPDESNVDELTNTVDEKFGFIDSIELCIDTVQDMINNIENGSAVFKVDIDSPWYSGEVTLFDLAWYVPFKTYGDLVFTGFAYIFFIFRVYKSIPSIINGFSSVTSGLGGGD